MVHDGSDCQTGRKASIGIDGVGEYRLTRLHGLEHGDVVGIAGSEHLALQTRELILVEREYVFVGGLLHVAHRISCESIFWISR